MKNLSILFVLLLGQVSLRAADLPEHWDAAHPDPIVDATQIWTLGGKYLDYVPANSHVEKRTDAPPGGDEKVMTEVDSIIVSDELKPQVFKGITASDTRRFLLFPSVKPAVQFSCARSATPYEDALEEALGGVNPELQLLSLTLLLRVKAPRSAAQQYMALQQLKKCNKGPQWSALLDRMEKEFEPAALERIVNGQIPVVQSRYSTHSAYTWAIRAAGAVQDQALLPELIKLSVSDNIDLSLAAERSLEDFEGPAGDQALVACMLGWQYNAYEHAAEALLKRNKKLLQTTLKSAKIPEERRHMCGLYLARCDDPDAVPILCETVPKWQIIDLQMFFQIERLAKPEHLPLIKALPARVREDQKTRAESVLKKFLEKLEAGKKSPAP